jgi:hypothetical protein
LIYLFFYLPRRAKDVKELMQNIQIRRLARMEAREKKLKEENPEVVAASLHGSQSALEMVATASQLAPPLGNSTHEIKTDPSPNPNSDRKDNPSADQRSNLIIASSPPSSIPPLSSSQPNNNTNINTNNANNNSNAPTEVLVQSYSSLAPPPVSARENAKGLLCIFLSCDLV